MDLRLHPCHACRRETETPQCGVVHTVLQGQVPISMGYTARTGLAPIQAPVLPEPMTLMGRRGRVGQMASSLAQLF